jgi:HSP20 family protein
MFRDPTHEFARLQQQISSLFSGAGGAVHEYPPVNISVTDDDAVVTAELPGVDPENLEIAVHNDTVTLKGFRVPVKLSDDEVVRRNERGHGQFTRTLTLPFRLNSESVKASLQKGVLTLTLPRAEQDKPRKIQVKAA